MYVCIYTHYDIVENTLYKSFYVCMYVWALYLIIRCSIMTFLIKKMR